MSFSSYIRFWWHSTNQHGVHSPFVFDLVTKCFYDKTKYKAYEEFSKLPIKGFSKRYKAFLYRIFQYFSYQNIVIYEKNDDILSFYTALFTIHHQKREVDMLLIDQNQPISIADNIHKMHNDSLLLLCKPYQSKEKENFWKEIISDTTFSVTIDTYHFGLAFVRREQRKQHFVIRL